VSHGKALHSKVNRRSDCNSVRYRLNAVTKMSDVVCAPSGARARGGTEVCLGGSKVDFIEKLWGLSPDGGSGATELAIFFVPLLVVLILVRRHQLMRTIHRIRSRD
jgi:hypothetical protein